MADPKDVISMKSCRICLTNKKPLCPLFRYKLSGNYAEMLTAIADVKVSSNDGLPDKICNKCCTSLEKAYLLRTVAERSDKILRKAVVKINENVPTKKIAFDSFTDIKSEIAPLAVKSEPKWEMEIEVLDTFNAPKPMDPIDGKDIVIANTVIRKVEPGSEEPKKETSEDVDLTWTKTKSNNYDAEYLDDDFFQDDDDDDYVPPKEKLKTKFKKPKLSDIKVFKEKKKTIVRKLKVLSKSDSFETFQSPSDDGKGKTATTITCYPIMKNGSRGPPILLKRPKDATILKVHPNYKPRAEATRLVRRDKPVRMVRSAKPVVKQREKMVCPVCGILTYTLGNHIATHQEKKRYSCSQCTRSFAQKANLQVHQKQHTGVKDHICEVCGAGFYSQKSLVRHNLIHKGERPYPCTLCNKRFIARCDLNRHLRIHSGYKPFKCATCTMSFNAKHQLQNHERMHTGERPYSCEVCNVCFSYKVNLNNHVYKVHGINLKFKSIHTVTEEILRREMGLAGEARAAIAHILPALDQPQEQVQVDYAVAH
ncbi:zinc finger protein 69-like isoform X1 [Cydia splendana]|uniref:zinc finger protein 69-like isoform X1 n=1 Tax=Cydia splendana TaxID=1100963 RepID=UPI0028F47154